MTGHAIKHASVHRFDEKPESKLSAIVRWGLMVLLVLFFAVIFYKKFGG